LRAVTCAWNKPGKVPGTNYEDEKEVAMNKFVKLAGGMTLIGALALASAMPSQARNGRNAAAAIGFGAGALVGAAAAGATYNNGYYGPSYYGDYAYEPGYAYAPGPAYAVPGNSYVYAPRRSYYDYYPNRWQDEHSTNNFSISSQS
jgi:hypothetical protein